MDQTTFDVAILALRAALGFVFVAHGLKHLKNRSGTTAWARSIGFRQPQVQWFFMTFAEIGIGVAMLAGLLTTVAAAGVVAMMTVAFWTVHRAAGFFITARPDEGYEYAAVLATAATAVALLGPGRVSVDHLTGLAVLLDGWVGAGVVAFGALAAFGQLAAFYRPGSVE